MVALSRVSVGWPPPAPPLLTAVEAVLPARELVCLLGPNGTGKTTLLRTILGLHAPLAGTIRLQGRDVGALSRRHMAERVSVVFPSRLVAGHLRARELVALGRLPYTSWFGRYRAADWRKAEEALAQVEADPFGHRTVAELSDGERQRVLIARALAQDTSLLLLDEPTAFLDIANRIHITHLLHRLAREQGKSILMSTHDLDLALHHADQLWLILPETGRLVTGAPEDLLLSGALQAAFAREGMRFDMESGSLRRRRAQGATVTVRGESTPLAWTRRALTRAGFQVTDAPSRMRVGYDGTTRTWTLHPARGAASRHATLYGLIRTLRGPLEAVAETGSGTD